jgi:hypothetical protein
MGAQPQNSTHETGTHQHDAATPVEKERFNQRRRDFRALGGYASQTGRTVHQQAVNTANSDTGSTGIRGTRSKSPANVRVSFPVIHDLANPCNERRGVRGDGCTHLQRQFTQHPNSIAGNLGAGRIAETTFGNIMTMFFSNHSQHKTVHGIENSGKDRVNMRGDMRERV